MSHEHISTQTLNRLTKNPKVSVIMNCLNCDKHLKEAIDSVYAQTYPNWEIIFWDNASTDSSAEIAKNYDNRLKYYKGKETVLLGNARNLALKKAKGEYIAFLDCDDMWLPEKLEKQMSLFEKDPDLGLVYSNCILLYWPSNRQEDVFSKAKAHRGHVLGKLFIVNFIPMLTVVTKKHMLVKNGYFCEDLQVGPDYDMWLRIAEKAPVDYVEESLAIYRIHDESFTRTNIALSPLEDIAILKRHLKRNPKLRLSLGKKVPKKFSDLYFALAVIYFKDNMIHHSFNILLRAFKLYPMNLPYWAFHYIMRKLHR